MVTRLLFNEVIKDVLGNLYDTASLETHPALFSVIKLPQGFTGNKGEYIRHLLLNAIEQLRPTRKDLAITAPEWRPYIILTKRYVECAGVQELSDELAISPRQMRRDHHRALVALCEILWTSCYPNEEPEQDSEQTPVFEVHNEMLDPLETTQGVFALLKKQFDDKGVVADFTPQQEFTPVITDRVILRQVLISLFNDILNDQPGHKLIVTCTSADNQVKVEFLSQISQDQQPTIETSMEDELTAIRYWCERINSRIEEFCTSAGNEHWVNRVLWLPHSDQKILLVIDDQDAVVNLFQRYLSQTEILTIGISHPEQAIALARHLQPALISLDVMMPQVDGWELLQLIKLDELLKRIPVIVCSAWDDPDLSHSLGAAAYLKKPVTQKMLLEAVNRLVPLEK